MPVRCHYGFDIIMDSVCAGSFCDDLIAEQKGATIGQFAQKQNKMREIVSG